MNIFLHELRSYQKSTIIWALSLSALVIVFLMLFPAFTKDVTATQKILENLPPALRDALGISLKNFFTIYGFFSYLLTFISLAFAIQAMNIGVSIISKEESGKTVDFLLSKPVKRGRIVSAKLLASFCLVLFTNLVFGLIALIMAKSVATGDFSAKIFILILLTLVFIQMFFLALGFLLAVIIPKIKSVIAVTLPAVFAFFVIGAFGAIIGDEKVRYLTPFKFYDPIYIITNSKYETRFLIIEIVFLIIAISASYIIFVKKDIHAVT